MSWNERIKAAREAQKLTREQTVRKMRDYLPTGKTAAARTLVAWEQSDSEPKVGECVIEACRKGSTWYIGGITNWQARDIDIDLGFLQGKTMTLYCDGINCDKSASDYVMRTGMKVPARLKLHLAPGGGFAAVVE